MSKPRFFLLDTLGDANDDDNCVLENFVDSINPESWRVHEGEPLGPIYPKDARIYAKGKDHGTRLGSIVGNTRSMLIVDPKFRKIIEKHTAGEKIEYQPVAIYDHRKRLMSDEYVIVNPLGAYDCIDLKASDVLYDEDNPKEILEVNDLVLDKAKAMKAPQLFRPEHSRSSYIIRYDIGLDMHQAKLTNIAIDELKFKA